MPIRTALWKVGAQPQPLPESTLDSEELLEAMIVAAPDLLSDEWMLIGRQENTGLGGIIDLLAIAPDSTLVLIELKRDKTPRTVVAQALDYASWVEKLKPEDIGAIYSRFSAGGDLAAAFQQRFGLSLDEDNLNSTHQIVIVAGSLDSGSERIVGYLNQRDIPINVLCFQVFNSGSEQFVSRSWLLDPVQTQVNAASKPEGQSEPWNGEFYCSFGDSKSRSWDDAVQFGFISAGGGKWYSNTLQALTPGDRVWVKIPGAGFVGVGKVTGLPEEAASFQVKTQDGLKPALEVLTRANYHREYAGNPDKCEYFVPIKWSQTKPISQAVQELGMFGNQNSICKPTTPKWRTTVEKLKDKFPDWDNA